VKNLAMRRIERLYALNERLRRSGTAVIPAHTLAEEFGVTQRTIERDLASLRSAGAPLYGMPGRNGGTGSIGQAGQAIVALSLTEIIGLIVAADSHRHGPFASAATSGVAKLIDAIDPAHRTELERLRDCFRIAPPTQLLRPRIRSVLEDAVAAQTVIRIVYVDRNDQRTTRSVEPVGFYQQDGCWSLVAWCQTRQAGRMFVLDRIERAVQTKVTFERRDVDHVLGWVPRPGRRP
jgi:predicted DNA-binding transcriptional regulator YafY